jgi:hypothetical protein
MQLSDAEADDLVRELQAKRCGGDDDSTLITWLSNRFRIGKNDARALHDSFYRGFQDGADSVVEVIDRKADEPRAPSSADTLYCAAYRLGQTSFAREYDQSLRRHQPRGCLSVIVLCVVMVALAFQAAG